MFARRVLSIASLYVVLVASAHAAPCAGFTDVDDTSPFCANVTYLKNRLITLGCLPGLYCPNEWKGLPLLDTASECQD